MLNGDSEEFTRNMPAVQSLPLWVAPRPAQSHGERCSSEPGGFGANLPAGLPSLIVGPAPKPGTAAQEVRRVKERIAKLDMSSEIRAA
jgi:hypothetical protein